MMTVTIRGRRAARLLPLKSWPLELPKGWARAYLVRGACALTTDVGNATPGRGGRRKRRRRSRQNPLRDALRSIWASARLRWVVLPAEASPWTLEARPILGRRERRRRAKLRRRRARRWMEVGSSLESAFSLPVARGPALDLLAKLYGAQRAPAAEALTESSGPLRTPGG
jgi:hypothetical protein